MSLVMPPCALCHSCDLNDDSTHLASGRKCWGYLDVATDSGDDFEMIDED
jgi:hypothetical protein